MNAPAKPHTHGPHYWFDEGSPVPLHARVLAALYGGMTGLRGGLYERKLLRRSHPGVPVIVVGNLIAGGAGKTPLTVALVERLRSEGWTPGVASRGYGRDGDDPLWVEADTPVAKSGDEPLLVARQTGARVRVDRNRAAAARALDIAVVPHAFPDHHRYRASDFEFGSRLPVLMTEKDAVKCAEFVDPSHYSVPVRAELTEAFWISLLDRRDGRSQTAGAVT